MLSARTSSLYQMTKTVHIQGLGWFLNVQLRGVQLVTWAALNGLRIDDMGLFEVYHMGDVFNPNQVEKCLMVCSCAEQQIIPGSTSAISVSRCDSVCDDSDAREGRIPGLNIPVCVDLNTKAIWVLSLVVASCLTRNRLRWVTSSIALSSTFVGVMVFDHSSAEGFRRVVDGIMGSSSLYKNH